MTIQELKTNPSSRIEYSRFYFWMAVVIALTAFIGFSRTFFLKEWTSSPPLPLILHIHGIVATGWILLFLSQTTLIDRHRVDLHRRLGITGVVLAVLLLVTINALTPALGRLHFVTICGGLFVMASAPARVLLGQTETWMQFARWLV